MADRQAASAQAADATDEVWPDHEIPLLVFRAALTQWRMGPAGPIGLDYCVLDERLARRLGITMEQLDEAMLDVQVMEDAGLAWFSDLARKSSEGLR